MRGLCSLEASYRKPIPVHNTLAGIPLTVYKDIIDHVFAVEVTPRLQNHCCDTSSPCVVLRRTMQICLPLLSVCKAWNDLVSDLMKAPQYWRLRSYVNEGVRAPWSYGNSWEIALDCILGGRYYAYKSIEQDHDKSLLYAYDFGGADGCHGKTEVVIKVSNAREQYENEKDVYTWFHPSDRDSRDVPCLYFADAYGPGSQYYALVLSKLGPDLDCLRLKCRHQRFTPRMTLAVAIQTIRMYKRLHDQGWLHCNAKAGNFAIGSDSPGKNHIFMFDFEYSQRIDPTPCTKPVNQCAGWNCLFRPVTWEMHLTPSRRDDLEGLGYVFSYLERGSHPWQHISPDEIWRIKITTTTKKLFEGMDPAYMRYFDRVKALAWGEVPDYDSFVQQFVEVWQSKGYGGTPGEIDWWGEFGLGFMVSKK